MADKLTLKLLVPTRAAVSRAIDSVNLCATEGEVGILPGHAAFLTALRPGPATLRDGASVEYWALSEGVLEVHDDTAMVLVRAAERSDEIDVERAKRRMAEREAELKGAQLPEGERMSEVAMLRAEASLAKQLVRLRVAALGGAG